MKFGDRIEYIEKNHYFTKKDCPFCTLAKNDKDMFISETKDWKIIYNKYPYYGDKIHLMAIPKRHISFTTELNDAELLDYKNVEIFMKDYYKNEKNYYSFIRQSIGGRSIEHLHYHYLSGHISYDEKSTEPIFRIKNK